MALGLAWVNPVAAQSCNPGEASHGFNYTGADQTLVVPAGVVSATVYLTGAQGAAGRSGAGTIGGSPNSPGGSGGLGSRVSGGLTVTPGSTLTIGVGGAGQTTVNAGGAGGGGAGGTGGGGTDLRIGATRIAIAAGGGGGGAAGWSSVVIAGGAGGNGDGAGVAGADATSGVGPYGGGGGNGTTGGAGGGGCGNYPAGAGNSNGTGGSSFNFFGSFSGAGFGGGGGGGGTVGAGGGGGGVGTTACLQNWNGGGGGGAGGMSSLGTLTDGALSAGVSSGDGSALICFAPPSYAISGTGSSTLGAVTLSLTGSSPTQTVTVPANAAGFAFPSVVPDGTTWNVAVTAKPANQSCTVAPASGTVAGADITNLVLSCQTLTAQTQSLTTVSGATGTVGLEQGATGGPFTSAAITANSNPAAGTASIIQVGGVQTLQFTAAANFVGTLTVSYTLSNATATSAPATVNITVNPARYSVGGTGSSALGYVTLQLTSTEAPQSYVVPANATNWTFSNGVLDNTSFQVAVTTKPSNQSCAVTPSSGTVAGAAVTNLVLACQTITAQNFSMTLLSGTTATQNLQTGATGGPFTGAAIVTPPAAASGTASISQIGGVWTLTFNAAPTFSGTTSLTYTLTSAVGTSTPATVTITVSPRPDPSLDPEVVGLVRGETETARRFAETQIRSFSDRLEQLHGEGAARVNSARLSVTGGDQTACAADNNTDEPGAMTRRPDFDCKNATDAYADPRNAAAYAGGATGGSSAVPGAAAAGAGGSDSPYAMWLGGYVNFGSANGGLADLNNTLVGVSGGIDYRFNANFTAGIGLGYGHDKTTFGSNSSRTLADAFSVAVYGSYRPSPDLYLDGLFGYSALDYDSDRYVPVPNLRARGQRDADQFFGSLTFGYEMRSPRGLLFAPYGRLWGSSTTLDAFTETGAGIWNLTFAEQTADTLSGTLGMRLENDFALDDEGGRLTGRFRFEYTHDFEGSSIANLGYADIGLLLYQIDAPSFSKNYLSFGLGFDAHLSSGTLLGVSYDGSAGLNGDSVQHLVQLKLAVPF